MTEIDLHGIRMDEAEAIFYDHLYQSRRELTMHEVTFITGRGQIKERLLALADKYDLHAYVPMANDGQVVIEFE